MTTVDLQNWCILGVFLIGNYIACAHSIPHFFENTSQLTEFTVVQESILSTAVICEIHIIKHILKRNTAKHVTSQWRFLRAALHVIPHSKSCLLDDSEVCAEGGRVFRKL